MNLNTVQGFRHEVYKPNLPESSKPISYGWQFSGVVVPEQPSSWTVVLDQQRIRSDQTSVEVAATQLRQLAPLLDGRPIVASDRWYSCAPFLLATEGLPFDKVLRLPRPPANVERHAKMGSVFSVATPVPRARLMGGGKAAMRKAIPSRSPGGRGCICPRHATSK